MPKINITVSEPVAQLATLASTDTVLVPLYFKGSSLGDLARVKEYSKKSDFTTDFPAANRIGWGTGTVTVDPSYKFVEILLDAGIKVMTTIIAKASDFADESAYNTQFATDMTNTSGHFFENLDSTNLYKFKFITAGAHSSCEGASGVFQNMLALSKDRLYDSIALVDFSKEATATTVTGYQSSITSEHNLEYASFFYPWVKVDGSYYPGALGYLLAYNRSAQNGTKYQATAGMERGYIPGCTGVANEVTVSVMHLLQCDADHSSTNVRINPIMHVNENDIRIWGNKTGYKQASGNGTSSKFDLHTINAVCDIKKQIIYSATYTMFDPDDSVTWFRFINGAQVLLDTLVSGRALEYYTWKREDANEGVIKATLAINPTKAVEEFDITIYMTNETLEVNS